MWWRRALVPVAVAGVVTVVLIATVPPVEASTAAVPPVATGLGPSAPRISLPPGRVLSAADPLRTWILGDSVMQDSSPGVTAALEPTGDWRVVANSSFGGWGLSTDHTWEKDLPQIISTWHPELVIGTWSWDAPLAQAHPHAYLLELIQALRTILAPGDGVDLVVLLQFPQVGPNTYVI